MKHVRMWRVVCIYTCVLGRARSRAGGGGGGGVGCGTGRAGTESDDEQEVEAAFASSRDAHRRTPPPLCLAAPMGPCVNKASVAAPRLPLPVRYDPGDAWMQRFCRAASGVLLRQLQLQLQLRAPLRLVAAGGSSDGSSASGGTAGPCATAAAGGAAAAAAPTAATVTETALRAAAAASPEEGTVAAGASTACARSVEPRPGRAEGDQHHPRPPSSSSTGNGNGSAAVDAGNHQPPHLAPDATASGSSGSGSSTSGSGSTSSSGFTPHGLYQLIWGLARLRHVPEPPFLELFCRAARQAMPDFTPQVGASSREGGRWTVQVRGPGLV